MSHCDNSKAAFPLAEANISDDWAGRETGMTLREHYAGRAMQGLLAADTGWTLSHEACAVLAVGQADALIEALAK